jgi:predicted DNA-binding protein
MKTGNTITLKLPDELSRWLDEEAERTGLPKGQLIRELLERARIENVRQPFLYLAGRADGACDLSSRRGFSK